MSRKVRFDFYVHGLWILGAIFAFLASMISGNLEWVTGTTEISYAVSVLLSLVLFLVAGMCWISASVNSRRDQR
ncbi:hypothetical protein CL614_04915 [archaeon]|nr:hypothetical protein [archaeon]|tara:strand:- start:856 stop:1077 length:222 start_codon:yes stop_codon:yes gene_type:complete